MPAKKAERTERSGDSATSAPSVWITRVEVLRKAPGRIPVEVAVIAEKDTAGVRAEGLAAREWVRVETRSRPKQVLLDPDWKAGFPDLQSEAE